MKKIAMLNCLRANEICAGAACFQAWNEKSKSFATYEGKQVQLMAFMRCNGCENPPEKDIGIIEKIQRLKKIGVEIVHVGICTKDKEGKICKTIIRIIHMLEEGIQIVYGTH